MSDFGGKTVIVIGASSGIGRKTAIMLSSLGARLILVSRRKEKLEEVLASLEGSGHMVYPMDVANIDSIETGYKDIIEKTGPVDGLVYAAGISRDTPVMQCKPDVLKDVFDVNYFGFVECVRQASRKGRYNPGFRIVAVSSISSLSGYKARLAYCSSKAAMNSAVKCMALELSSKGICVNAVAPAVTRTEMFEKLIEENGEEAVTANLLSRQYLGIAEPEDIANAIIYLLSSEARFITGITLPVDGGATTS